MEMNEIFVRRLRELTFESGMSQKQIAQLCGATEASLSRYMNGERMPKAEILANLATALNTTTDYLLGRQGKYANFQEIRAIVARGRENMTAEEREEISRVLFGINRRMENWEEK